MTTKHSDQLLIKKHALLPFVAQQISSHPIIVEAGAFNGTDTKKLASFWPRASIHAFEPVPEIFALLEENTRDVPQVTRYQRALSNTNDTAPFYVSENPQKPGQPFPAGSLREPHERLHWSPAQYTNIITVPTITLDAWAQCYGVDHIDFMWLDVQGHALSILQAAPHMITRIHVLYIEVEFIEAYKNQALYDEVHTWLEKQGFTLVATDFTDQTSWFFGNALFIRKN